MRGVTSGFVAGSIGIVAVAALLFVATLRIPAVWGFAWSMSDWVTGGYEERHERLVENPFPARLAPPGYRLERTEEMVDPDGYRHGVRVVFVGPDGENSIEFLPNAMSAPEVFEYWKRPLGAFGRKLVAAEDVGPDSFCSEGALFEQHEVSCVAAFDGLAVIADSVNTKPREGELRHAVTLLRAGTEHWESIKD